eukprot:CAMPEP_0206242740 /NCGR_PEP_ID=MMETSP0047_2-20121206/17220_1 /ASSEMBLY_ACC=CAM_ASM_000192 /TAXON_ID=195065 /ORGANISM="Chroomonas mesostigmatica_cf, Strain CCMP1168" /LENGTH=97 /DNA_ID=CAMNT_0053667783 /DNA_START=117 /DNA_END=411 /DNA_ORIENTATION=-
MAGTARTLPTALRTITHHSRHSAYRATSPAGLPLIAVGVGGDAGDVGLPAEEIGVEEVCVDALVAARANEAAESCVDCGDHPAEVGLHAHPVPHRAP